MGAMLSALDALFAYPPVMFAVMLVGAGIYALIDAFGKRGEKRRRRPWRRSFLLKLVPKSSSTQAATEEAVAVDFAARQLRDVMHAGFQARALLNSAEQRLLIYLERLLAQSAPGWRVMAQVSLGEIMSSADKNAFLAVNSKRVDLLIIDDRCRAVCAIEYQGTGHFLSKTTAARDAVKKEALRRANIGYVEVAVGDTQAQLRMALLPWLPQIAEVAPARLQILES